ncbi:hypothetical protein FGG08_000036 [Glutinoglossum americanum]|uniref:Signal peptidase subunit 3 n=1 Tax=Glutinoglossum americanum TaxID=1670608 RepID=A0A9P8IDX8_9PEZI|nr:hypothetical protein FGG08_000036 [Glutinoglossum americanum]
MHSTVVRAQNIFGLFTTVAFFVSAFIGLSVLFYRQAPSADVNLKNLQVVKGRPHYYSSKREEYAHIRFDLDAGEETSFYLKVFVYILAKWPSPGKPDSINEAVIWDQIIPADPSQNPNIAPERRRKSLASPPSKAERGLIRLHNAKSKYQITDRAGKIAERSNATLELGWNVQPWVGALAWTTHMQLGSWKALQGGRSKPFNFPELQVKKKSTGGRSN